MSFSDLDPKILAISLSIKKSIDNEIPQGGES